MAVDSATTSQAQDSLWVAGYQDTDTGLGGQLVYRYTDGQWQSITSRGLENFAYTWEVDPVSDDDVWLAGTGGIAHYDGSEWTQAQLPDPAPLINIQDLNVVAPNDIWAVGDHPDSRLWRRPLVLHYDGTQWTEIPAPAETAQLMAIELVNGEPFAVGARGDNLVDPYVLRLEGGRFVRSQDPPSSGILTGTVLDQGHLWAVGTAALAGAQFDPYIAFTE